MNSPSRRHAATGWSRRAWMTASGAAALAHGLPAHAQTVDEFGRGALRGAGSTFVHPLMAEWARAYRAARTGGAGVRMAGGGLDDEIGGAALDYEAVGSMAGIARVRSRSVDFAASEMPLPNADLERDGLLQVPLVAGAVAVAAHLPGLSGRELRLDAELLAEIYLGRVKTWSDPAIARFNTGLALPDAPIVVLHRADGSGTTFTFTRYLAQVSAAWGASVGSDLLVNWPVGAGHRGNGGVATALERTPHAIGYVSQAQLPPQVIAASLRNPAGQFVAPSRAGVAAALAAVRWNPADGFASLLVHAPAPTAYPVAAAVFGVLNERAVGFRRRLARAFFDWAVTQGGPIAERLSYTPLPADVAKLVTSALR